ncbi:glycosyltransferase family 4 protein [Haloarcula laminariae]|uniref:glycosyltransferase family 4 protein n=1 Tax=Haloarcula laminariae TaxID=2961577 RepID=UPI0024051CFD|nr:glycosyltransferase family 1 protein [Halomicroarcula sp. FL173]
MDVAFQGTINFGGLGRVTTELCRALGDYCSKVTVYPTVLSVEDPESHEWWDNMPSNVQLAPKKGLVGGYARNIRDFTDHDVVHVNYATLGSSAKISNLISDVPYIYTVHGFGTPDELVMGLKTRLLYKLETELFLPTIARSGKLATISEYNERMLRKHVGDFDPEIVYHGIETEAYENSTTSLSDFDVSLDASGNEDILLFVGRFHKYKDVPTLLKAFDIVTEHRDEVKLVLVGGGKNTDTVLNQVEELGIEDDVVLIRDAEDDLIVSLYNSATALAFPSYGEGFGLIYLEALAAGLPVVCVDEGAAPEVVGEAGIMTEARSPSAFAEGLLRLLDDKDLREQLSQQGRERAQSFTWEQAAERYTELYRQAIANHD